MKLEDIVNIREIDQSVSERGRLVANFQVRGNFFFTLFKHALKPYDISEVQFNVLKILQAKHPDPVSSGDVSRLLISQASDVTRIVDRMIKKDLVTREVPEGNRRLVLISLTKNGLKKLNKTDNVVSEVLKSTEVWSDDEVEALNKLLDKLG